jgi:hypothetical protein
MSAAAIPLSRLAEQQAPPKCHFAQQQPSNFHVRGGSRALF